MRMVVWVIIGNDPCCVIVGACIPWRSMLVLLDEIGRWIFTIIISNKIIMFLLGLYCGKVWRGLRFLIDEGDTCNIISRWRLFWFQQSAGGGASHDATSNRGTLLLMIGLVQEQYGLYFISWSQQLTFNFHPFRLGLGKRCVIQYVIRHLTCMIERMMVSS